MNRSVIACLVAVVLLGGVSSGQWGDPWYDPWGDIGESPTISGVEVVPLFPTVSDALTFSVSGSWVNSCVPGALEIDVQGQSIYLNVIWNYSPDLICAQVMSNWIVTKSIDPLPEGEYDVYCGIGGAWYSLSMVLFIEPDPWYWPPSEVIVSPGNPTSADEVAVVLEGQWLDTCVPTGVEARRDGRSIYLDVMLDYSPRTGCGDAITPWREEASLGKLEAGTYAIYGRIAENVMVPETEYVKLKDLNVTLRRQEGGLYLFLPEESFVTQTGGIAGITEKYEVDGMFALEIDFAEGVASFVEVDATLSQKGYLPTTSLGELFNMENLTSTSVSADAIRFTGFTEDDAEVVIEALFSESNVHLVGRIRPGCCDRFDYDLDGFAVPIKEPICREVPEMDFTGDCRVDLADLAVFAQSWMECNLFPRSACR